MIVKFKNPHPGVGGPIEALSENVAKGLSILSGMETSLEDIIGNLAIEIGRGYWVSVDMDLGWILLMKKTADPTAMVSRWKLIEFEEVQP